MIPDTHVKSEVKIIGVIGDGIIQLFKILMSCISYYNFRFCI